MDEKKIIKKYICPGGWMSVDRKSTRLNSSH